MYLRTVKAKGANGVEFEYIRLVEAYWEDGHSKQRVVANLGRKDILAPHVESLIQLLGGGKKTKANSLSCAQHIEATVAACWGPMLVARSLWRQLGLESILDGLAPKTNTAQKVAGLALADRVFPSGRDFHPSVGAYFQAHLSQALRARLRSHRPSGTFRNRL